MSQTVVAAIADLVGDVPRPVLLGVDGPDGAGKTRFADALVDELAGRGLVVAQASVDNFHHPRGHRHAAGRTAQSVWSRSYDYRAMRRELLDPWRRGPGADYTPVWHDVDTDEYVEPLVDTVPERGVLVVDGIFLQRPEIVDAWDLTVYLDVPPQVTVPRMAARDGTPADVDHPDQVRYLQAQEHYRETCDPLGLADVVVDNSDWASPRMRLDDRPGAAGSSRPGDRPGDRSDARWRRDGDEIIREVRLPYDAHERAAAIDRLADG